MHDAVEDGVGEGRIVEVGVPMFDRQLTGDQSGFAGSAIVEQFEQVVAFGLADRCEPPIVEDQEIGAGELLAAAEAAVTVGDTQFFEQAAEASVEDGEALATCSSPGTGEPGLARPVAPVMRTLWPLRSNRHRRDWRVGADRGRRRCASEVLDAGVGIFELGLFEQTFQRRVSRPASSRSTRRPKRSSKARPVATGWASCSSKARAMPSRRRVRRWVTVSRSASNDLLQTS